MNLVRSGDTEQPTNDMDVFLVVLGEELSMTLDAETTDEVRIATPAGVSVKVGRSSRPKDYGNDDYTPVPTAKIKITFDAPGQHLVEISISRNGILLSRTRQLYEAS